MQLLPHSTATECLMWGFVIHLFADWFLQNDWMAKNKTSLKHPAAWVHSGIHFLFALLVFPWQAALFIFVTHILIDLRIPLTWWGNLIGQTKMPVAASAVGSPNWGESAGITVAISLAFWRDQVAHIAILAIAALLWAG